MTKPRTRILAALLSVCLLFGLFAGFAVPDAQTIVDAVQASAQPKPADAAPAPTAAQNTVEAVGLLNAQAPAAHEGGCTCGYSPTIIVHGIGQSKVVLYENNEVALDSDGNPITVWPISVDSDALIGDILWPALRMLFTQRDLGFGDALAAAIKAVFSLLENDSKGEPVKDIRVEEYRQSIAECTEEEKQFIYDAMPLQAVADIVGEDHMFYFAYNSFGNIESITKDMDGYIDMVREDTGHDKVNVVFISLGGTVSNHLLEYYPAVYDKLDTVTYVIAALDGSKIIGDVMTNNLSLNDEMLYHAMLPSFMDEYLGYLINIALRIIPKKVLLDALDAAIEELILTGIVKSTVMWALVPQDDYAQAREKWLLGDGMEEILRQTDAYAIAQKNSSANIQKLQQSGARVYAIANYNVPLYSIAASYDDYNADGIIHLGSTSLGATSGLCFTPLAKDYAAESPVCTNAAHNHLSPDGIVDASTGALPEHTFYFANQDHEKTARNDVIISLVTALSTLPAGTYPNVREVAGYPQFNEGRNSRDLQNRIRQAKEVDTADLAPEDVQELTAAIAEAEAQMATTVVDAKAFAAAEKRLNAILVKLGVREEKSTFFEDLATVVLRLASKALYECYGPRGFSDPRCMNNYNPYN